MIGRAGVFDAKIQPKRALSAGKRPTCPTCPTLLVRRKMAES